MNYDEIGFKCGIEIHQQLKTDTKLFCDCPVDLRDENASGRIQRYLRAVAGETGETDEAAEAEAAGSRKFIYKYYNRNNCLVELDEEPPHEMDEEALQTGLTFARMVEADVPDEIQVMRKMVVDGSNTSGFQRTSMIGLDGEIDVGRGGVTIDDIELEEESAGIHEKDDEKAVYDLNRLGVPLIEVGTDASIQDPEHAEQVARRIGMLLRSTGKARRGIGTIRQDVNVSIDGGARVEIKGFQDVDNLENLIRNEVKRQKNLIELGEELGECEELVADNVTHLFEETDNQIVSTVLENDGAVYGFRLPELEGRMKENISSDRYLALELVDYAKKYGIQGIIHTDEEQDYGLEEEFEEMGDLFNRKEGDVLAVMAGPRENVKEAAKAVRDRARKIYGGEVPEETRNAEQDFTTSYMRPLPGSARMYPETDIRPITVTDEDIMEIDSNLPRTLDERFEDYSEEIGDELARQVVYSEKLSLFERFRDEADSRTVANLFSNIVPRLKSEGVDMDSIEESKYGEILSTYDTGKISKGDIEEVLRKAVKKPVEDAVEDVLAGQESEEELREIVREVLEQNREMIEEQGEHARGALMGQVMGQVDASGDKVSEVLGEEIQDYL